MTWNALDFVLLLLLVTPVPLLALLACRAERLKAEKALRRAATHLRLAKGNGPTRYH